MQAPVINQVAVCQIIVACPDGDRFQTAIGCHHFDCTELAQLVAQQYPNHVILSARWLH